MARAARQHAPKPRRRTGAPRAKATPLRPAPPPSGLSAPMEFGAGTILDPRWRRLLSSA